MCRIAYTRNAQAQIVLGPCETHLPHRKASACTLTLSFLFCVMSTCIQVCSMHHHIPQGPKAMRTLVSHILCMQNFRIGRLSAHSMRGNDAFSLWKCRSSCVRSRMHHVFTFDVIFDGTHDQRQVFLRHFFGPGKTFIPLCYSNAWKLTTLYYSHCMS